jgi:hypothetical protein
MQPSLLRPLHPGNSVVFGYFFAGARRLHTSCYTTRVNRQYLSLSSSIIALTAMSIGAFAVACANPPAPRSAEASTTAGEVNAPAAAAASPAGAVDVESPDYSLASSTASSASTGANELAADAKRDVPVGQLVCKTKTQSDGTSELFLTWDGDSGKGVLRRSAPSGMVYLLPVRAERASGTIVADDPAETDLVVHAALVREANGKQLMRLGDGSGTWSACE